MVHAFVFHRLAIRQHGRQFGQSSSSIPGLLEITLRSTTGHAWKGFVNKHKYSESAVISCSALNLVAKAMQG